ncbi:MAG: glutathione S-transferase [Rhodocyclaceae bacterium]|nr:glutathione S-transferase [Rhodocyclaceae bacterium]
MKLIGTFTSPYVRKTRIVLAEKKIDYEFVLDSPWEEGSGVPDLNPLGKVPILILDDDSTLFDSRVICEYLDNAAPNNRLLPQTNRERIQVKRWEALSDGVCDAAANIVLENRRKPTQRSKEWLARQQDKVGRGVKMMSEDLGDAPWCHGNGLTLADIAACVALDYLSFRLADFDWRTPYPNLVKLRDKLTQRTSFADSAPHD